MEKPLEAKIAFLDHEQYSGRELNSLFEHFKIMPENGTVNQVFLPLGVNLMWTGDRPKKKEKTVPPPNKPLDKRDDSV